MISKITTKYVDFGIIKKTFYVVISIKNQGNLFANTIFNPTLLQSIGSNLIKVTYQNPLMPGKIYNFTSRVKANWKGPKNIRFEIDPKNDIDESIEVNNQSSVLLIVK